jgi:hypothetical protein
MPNPAWAGFLLGTPIRTLVPWDWIDCAFLAGGHLFVPFVAEQ